MNDQVIDFAEDNGLKFDSLEKVRIFTQRMDGSVPRNDEQRSLGMTKKRDYTDGENIILSGRKKYRLSETQFSGLHNAMNILSVAMVADEMRIPVERIGKYLSEIG